MKSKIIISIGLCLAVFFFLSIIFRLPEYYSLKKNSLCYYSKEGKDTVKIIYYYQERKGYDSAVISLNAGEVENVADNYGKQFFVFYINGYRWDPKIGFWKVKGWYKFKLRIYLNRLNDRVILRARSTFNGSTDEKIDTILMPRASMSQLNGNVSD